MSNITQAFIFAAGRGERMRPITDTIPKPLVKINNKSIIDYSIQNLLKIKEINKIIINGYYLSQKIESHIDSLNNDKIIFSKELEKIETGGGLIFAKDKIDFSKPLLTINGDILWQEDAKEDINLMSQKFSDLNCDILLGLKKIKEYHGYDSNNGDFNLNEDGSLSKDDNMNYAFVGIQIINPKILLEDFVTNLGKCFSLSQIYEILVKDTKRIKGVELKGEYYHIGTTKAIQDTELLLKQ